MADEDGVEGESEKDPTSRESGDFDRAMELVAQAERELAAIDAAIVALAEGTFGRCDVCGKPVEDEILKDRIDARRCSEHSS